MKYLRVTIEGPHTGDDWTLYAPVEEGVEDDQDELDRMAQDLVATVYTYGRVVVDESEVPEGERA